MSGPTVAEPAPRTQRRGRRAPHVGYPMCTHAYVASAFGASRLHGLLADWPRSYAEAILRTARPGWETAGAAPKRRHSKRPVDIAHDMRVAQLIYTGKVDAHVMWPQVALQPWMIAPKSRIQRGISDMSLPRACS
mmetsp:Transcript_41921/g.135987  ORF Transcript_41921/g.135987 Transcript_41921/m.135987 type:complete len:135 (-) Transcript_41921:205-609(-)